MTPQQYRAIVGYLLKIASTLKDEILLGLINKAEADWVGTATPFEERTVILLRLAAGTIDYNNKK
jgi:hypothetical protein